MWISIHLASNFSRGREQQAYQFDFVFTFVHLLLLNYCCENRYRIVEMEILHTTLKKMENLIIDLCGNSEILVFTLQLVRHFQHNGEGRWCVISCERHSKRNRERENVTFAAKSMLVNFNCWEIQQLDNIG